MEQLIFFCENVSDADAKIATSSMSLPAAASMPCMFGTSTL